MLCYLSLQAQSHPVREYWEIQSNSPQQQGTDIDVMILKHQPHVLLHCLNIRNGCHSINKKIKPIFLNDIHIHMEMLSSYQVWHVAGNILNYFKTTWALTRRLQSLAVLTALAVMIISGDHWRCTPGGLNE